MTQLLSKCYQYVFFLTVNVKQLFHCSGPFQLLQSVRILTLLNSQLFVLILSTQGAGDRRETKTLIHSIQIDIYVKLTYYTTVQMTQM